MVQWLAGNGGSVTQPTNAARTPLYVATQKGHLAVVQWLASNGGSVTQPTSRGSTHLYIAALNDHLEVVRWLASNGGSVTQPAITGRTPLHVAAQAGHLEVVRLLAGNGGSVTQPANNRVAPLLAAARFGHLKVVQWLACNGGSVTQPANNGVTAFAAATALGHDGVAAFLTAALSWSAFKILVACRRTDDAKLALQPSRSMCWPHPPHRTRRRQCEPSRRTLGGLTRRLSGHAPARAHRHGPWTPSRQFLFHAGVRTHIRVGLLSANRIRDRHDIPTKTWEMICSFFRRSVWEAPVA